MLSIQILQYEFLGPIKLEEWGPPMEKVVYLILTRTKDVFNILYVDECENTTDNAYFIKNSSFKYCVEKAGSDKLLYLAILPMFESTVDQRNNIVSKIISKYQPICNMMNMPEQKPDYVIRSKSDKVLCPCCGSEMRVEKIMEKSSIIKCPECGLSDTKINS